MHSFKTINRGKERKKNKTTKMLMMQWVFPFVLFSISSISFLHNIVYRKHSLKNEQKALK